MSAYEIMINAKQRELLTHACREVLKTSLTPAARDELELLFGMFDNLPAADSDDNFFVDSVTGQRCHLLHGFCL